MTNTSHQRTIIETEFQVEEIRVKTHGTDPFLIECIGKISAGKVGTWSTVTLNIPLSSFDQENALEDLALHADLFIKAVLKTLKS